VGSEASRLKPGDEVLGGAGGAFAEYASVRESRAVVHKPANMTFEQAATIPIADIQAAIRYSEEGQVRGKIAIYMP
jgi:NADPH:quinone reductase-like Zn-dependent oxidoreductase